MLSVDEDDSEVEGAIKNIQAIMSDWDVPSFMTVCRPSSIWSHNILIYQSKVVSEGSVQQRFGQEMDTLKSRGARYILTARVFGCF